MKKNTKHLGIWINFLLEYFHILRSEAIRITEPSDLFLPQMKKKKSECWTPIITFLKKTNYKILQIMKSLYLLFITKNFFFCLIDGIAMEPFWYFGISKKKSLDFKERVMWYHQKLFVLYKTYMGKFNKIYYWSWSEAIDQFLNWYCVTTSKVMYTRRVTFSYIANALCLQEYQTEQDEWYTKNAMLNNYLFNFC